VMTGSGRTTRMGPALLLELVEGVGCVVSVLERPEVPPRAHFSRAR
jgi:hypothetical protein